jgi:hypothetical protein
MNIQTMMRPGLFSSLMVAGFVTLTNMDVAAAEGAAPAPAVVQSEASVLYPRFTLIEVQYPQLLAASLGSWALLRGGGKFRPGLVSDFEVGLGGGTLSLGAGATSAPTVDYEHAISFGIQGAIHRTWPWWSPWLPTAATFLGAEAFAQVFAFRCSLGLMWSLNRGQRESPFLVGGCGLGL